MWHTLFGQARERVGLAGDADEGEELDVADPGPNDPATKAVLQVLIALRPDLVKIASGEITNLPLLRRVGAGVASTLPPHARILIAGDFRESTPVLKAAMFCWSKILSIPG